MAETAAHLVDKVFPHKPLRQWVLSFPYQLRFLFAKDPKVMGEVLTVVNRAISTYLIKKAGLTKKSGAKTGSVTFIQRFGGSLNLNIHFHMMILDGVYTFNEGPSKFHFITPPSLSEMEGVLTTIAQRVVKLLEKRELIIKDDNQGFMNRDSHGVMDQIHGSSISYRIAFGKYKGRKALTLQTVSSTNPQTQFLAKHSGFSLHAGVSCGTNDRKKRERICRYISRPSLSEKRLSLNAHGQVVYELKKAYDNGTTHIIFNPLDFLSRLASLIPRPKVNLTRFHGVFAPHFKYRMLVVPESPQEDHSDTLEVKKSRSMSWAQRLKRVFDIDIETGSDCGGKIKVIAIIEDYTVAKKILTHIGLDSKAPTPWSPRGPPQTEEDFTSV